MRKDCVINLIHSIRKKYKTIDIVVVDDSDPPLNFNIDNNIKTYNIDFDSGLSAGRNYGVSKINTPYFVLLDDDFEFTENTKIEKFYETISITDLDILGGQVINNEKVNNYFTTRARKFYQCARTPETNQPHMPGRYVSYQEGCFDLFVHLHHK